jgi:predicted nucleic acid-binding protein
VIIISDNSALSALSEIGLLDLLPAVFGEVVIPEAVRKECEHERAPQVLRKWIALQPGWVRIVADPAELLVETANLGPGEAAAISLAWEHRRDCRLILDEKRGRRVAEALGLQMTGVLGIIGEAACLGLVDFEEAVKRLRAADFRMAEAVIEAVRKRLS